MLSKHRPGRSAALLATLLLFALGALHGAAAGLGSVTATRLADFPPGLSLRVLPSAGNDFDPELIELAESLLRDQGADVSAGARYTLYLRRIVSSSNRADKPRIAISGTGFSDDSIGEVWPSMTRRGR